MSEESDRRRRIEIEMIGNKLMKRIYDSYFQLGVCLTLIDEDFQEDFSTLTASEIMNKIREFTRGDPNDIHYNIFLHYLAHYPVSMCKRDVSPVLKALIGFHYRLGEPNEEHVSNGAEKVSYDDLSKIFVRSKATVSECVNRTETAWNEIQQKLQQEQVLEEEARKQLLEEKKKELVQMEENKQKNSPNERTTDLTTGGG